MKKTIFLIGIIFIFLMSVTTATPNDLNIQIGKLFNNSKIVEDSVLEINFSIWDVPTGGSPIFTVEKNLSVHNGTTDVIIQPSEEIFKNNSKIYLSITVEDDSESLPRINFTSVPYALVANISDSVRNNSITNESIDNSDDFTFNDVFGNALTLIGDFIGRAINATNVNVSKNLIVLGNVGIGTTLPAEKLVVIGNVNISGTLNVSGNVTLSGITDCNTGFSLGTTSTGEVSCVVDADSGATGDTSSADDWNWANNASLVLDNITINRSINLDNYNQSVSLDNYLTSVTNDTEWNVTSRSDATSLILKDADYRVLIGRINHSIENVSELLTIIGNVNVSGYINISGLFVTSKTVMDNGTLNKSISLDNYNSSISLDNYNQSIDLTPYAPLDSPTFTTAFTAAGLVGDEDLQSEDFGEFTCAGEDACTINSGVIDADNLGANSCQDSEIDYSAVTLSDFTNDAKFITNLTDIKETNVNITNSLLIGNGSNIFELSVTETGNMIIKKKDTS